MGLTIDREEVTITSSHGDVVMLELTQNLLISFVVVKLQAA